MDDFRQELAKDWYGQTVLHPLGLTAVFILGTLMLLVPRRYALLPLIAMACFIAPAQRLVIFGFDFNLMRVMVVFGWLRLILRQEYTVFRWRALDSVFVLWLIVGTVAYTIQTNGPGVTERMGWILDAAGLYFLARILVQNWGDVATTIGAYAILSIPCAIVFMIELSTGRNMFGIFGGVPEITSIRQGELRAQGAFAHPILAGCFWATAIPLMIGRAIALKQGRIMMIVGVCASLIVIYACRSSTPVLALLAGAIGAGCYFLRRWLGWILIGAAMFFTFLHFVMRGPVWALLAKTDVIAGSTGYHRYALFDAFVNRVDEWWMVGTPSTAHWGWGLHDVTNHFVFEAIKGGLGTLLLFLAIIVLAFRAIGRVISRSEREPRIVVLAWAIGVSLFVHITCFWSISYFGQMILPWYLTIGIIVSLDAIRERPVRVTKSLASIAHGPSVHAETT